MTLLCPTCRGTMVDCPTCGMPDKKSKSVQISVSISGRQPVSITDVSETAADWEVQGVDLSRWNGNVDFSITKQKCQYAYIRLGYGTQWKDPKADVFYQDAMANDFPLGVYWYCSIGDPVGQMADSFAHEISSHPPQLDIVLDIESTSLNTVDTLNWILAMYTKMYTLTGKKPMIYTSPGFWNGKVARSNHWTDRDLWVAAWTTYPSPLMPHDWSKWIHWQWSADNNKKGAEYGATGGDPDMDLNRFNGTVEQFNLRYGTHIKPIGDVTPPPPPPNIPEKVAVTSYVVNLRHVPDASSPSTICGKTNLGNILYPEAIELDSRGREWYKLGKKIYIAKWLTKPI